jgi:hypothetical protein
MLWRCPTDAAGLSQSKGRLRRETGHHAHCRIVKSDEVASRRAVVSWRGSIGVLEPDMGKLVRPVVCPAKAGIFSRRQSCRGKSEKPRSLEGSVAGNQDVEASRRHHQEDGGESPGRNDSERKVASKVQTSEGRARNRRAKAAWRVETLTETTRSLWRGGSDGMVARRCSAPGEALLVPPRKRWSKVGSITSDPGK